MDEQEIADQKAARIVEELKKSSDEHFKAAVDTSEQMKSWRDGSTLNPKWVLYEIANLHNELGYLYGSAAVDFPFILRLDRTKASRDEAYTELEGLRKEVEAEFAKRKKGFDWVDNLISHTPTTEENPI